MHLTYCAILLFVSFLLFLPLRHLALGIILSSIAVQVQKMVQPVASMTCGLGLLPDLLCQFIVPAGDFTTLFSSTIQTQFSALEGLLYDVSEVTPLVSALTESRLLVSDLASAVRASSLSSSMALAEELAAISTDTKEASRNLQKLLAQAFDRILFQFRHSLSLLILRAVKIQGNLDSIESCLEVVRDLVAMEASVLMVEKSDVLANILTVLQETMELLRSLVTGVGLVEGVPLEALVDALTVGIQRLHHTGRFGPTRPTGYNREHQLLVGSA
ncbi:hypothetical protein M404DRAFT_949658 [Pisolithus tinctorius Marx 270]|uniref:Uncharacterized protein n=1 Tax=Pisolithus tinctorius Marx 270 TaxID=870435 RepID=A0A0C3PAJ1_PISTI|nr:hypothetical protein M404DRAFT_949658 [Pisolithus tinctorius Marx 270]